MKCLILVLLLSGCTTYNINDFNRARINISVDAPYVGNIRVPIRDCDNPYQNNLSCKK